MSVKQQLLDEELSETAETAYSTYPTILSGKGEKLKTIHPATKHVKRLRVVFQLLSIVNIIAALFQFSLSLSISIYDFIVLRQAVLLQQVSVLTIQLLFPFITLFVFLFLAFLIIFTPTVIKIYQRIRKNSTFSIDTLLLFKVVTAVFLGISTTQFIIDILYTIYVWSAFLPVAVMPQYQSVHLVFRSITFSLYIGSISIRSLIVFIWEILFIVFWVLCLKIKKSKPTNLDLA